jgi:hypothetical protein
MAWLADLLGLGEGWHRHIAESASSSTFAVLVAAAPRPPASANALPHPTWTLPGSGGIAVKIG